MYMYMYMLIYIIVHSIYIVLYLMVYMYILICIFVYIFVLCSSLRCTGTIYILYMLICLQYLYCTLPYGVHVQCMYTSYFVYSICIVLYLMVYRYNVCIQVILFTVFVLYSTLWCTGTMYIYMLICLQYLYCTLPHGVQVQCIYTSY